MDRRVVKTKEAIKNAYFALLSESEDGKVTITDIAKRADIDRKTFYLHYESVEQLMKDFSQDRISGLYAYLNEKKFFENPYAKTAIFDALSYLVGKDLELYRELARNENCAFFWLQIEKELVKVISEVYLREGMYTKNELEILGRFFTAGTINIYKSWLRGEVECSLSDLGILASEISFRGIVGIIEFGQARKKG